MTSKHDSCSILSVYCFPYNLLSSEYHEEWKGWQTLGDPVLHIQLRDWADIAVVAPLSAHSLAKIATGLCDDPLSCVLRAWDLGYHATRPGKPLVLAPAMNTAMWEVGDFGIHVMGETNS
jgi:phosphopantothenoylcysteine decarboxylase